MGLGKKLLFFLLTHIACNGWWYCATQQVSLGESPLVIFPVFSTIGLCWFVAIFIAEKWDA